MSAIKSLNLSAKTIGIIMLVVSVILLALIYFYTIDMQNLLILQCKAFGLHTENCPHENILNSIPLQSYVGFTLGLFLAVLGVYLFFAGKRYKEEISEKEKKLEIEIAKLDVDERKICSLIKESGNVAFQSDLVKKSAFNKAKVSRILDRLEGKGLIERRRKGMTNLVLLK